MQPGRQQRHELLNLLDTCALQLQLPVLPSAPACLQVERQACGAVVALECRGKGHHLHERGAQAVGTREPCQHGQLFVLLALLEMVQ